METAVVGLINKLDEMMRTAIQTKEKKRNIPKNMTKPGMCKHSWRVSEVTESV